MKKCFNPKCSELTSNPKYCSRSCSAKHNNVIYPKRKTKKLCIVCNQPVKSYRQNRCKIHHNEYMKYKSEEMYQEKTIGEYRNLKSVKGKHPSWIHSHIRLFNRRWNKHLTELPCAKCGYSHHVELCHIKAVSSFNDTELLSTINHPDNNVQLCRNCHWELDNHFFKVTKKEGFLEFEDLCKQEFPLESS